MPRSWAWPLYRWAVISGDFDDTTELAELLSPTERQYRAWWLILPIVAVSGGAHRARRHASGFGPRCRDDRRRRRHRAAGAGRGRRHGAGVPADRAPFPTHDRRALANPVRDPPTARRPAGCGDGPERPRGDRVREPTCRAAHRSHDRRTRRPGVPGDDRRRRPRLGHRTVALRSAEPRVARPDERRHRADRQPRRVRVGRRRRRTTSGRSIAAPSVGDRWPGRRLGRAAARRHRSCPHDRCARTGSSTIPAGVPLGADGDGAGASRRQPHRRRQPVARRHARLGRCRR